MGLRCLIFGCGDKSSNFYHYGSKGRKYRKCKKCGSKYIFIDFYHHGYKSWVEKEFVDHWKTYENLNASVAMCADCDTEMPKCRCNSC